MADPGFEPGRKGHEPPMLPVTSIRQGKGDLNTLNHPKVLHYGGDGIRTHVERETQTDVADQRLKPLSHTPNNTNLTLYNLYTTVYPAPQTFTEL